MTDKCNFPLCACAVRGKYGFASALSYPSKGAIKKLSFLGFTVHFCSLRFFSNFCAKKLFFIFLSYHFLLSKFVILWQESLFYIDKKRQSPVKW